MNPNLFVQQSRACAFSGLSYYESLAEKVPANLKTDVCTYLYLE